MSPPHHAHHPLRCIAAASKRSLHIRRISLRLSPQVLPLIPRADWPMDPREMGPKFQSQRVKSLPQAHVEWVYDSLNLYLEVVCDG
jgi:hypothetical protein